MLSLVVGLVILGATPVISVQCPGGEVECPDDYTCCLMPNRMYGCCPIPNAVCCSDLRHCCPYGYKCDTSGGACIRGKHVLQLLKKIPSLSVKVASPIKNQKDVLCPDESVCPDGNTCCLTEFGLYGCCPTPKAVCCLDRLHCCPSGYKCDLARHECVQENVQTNSQVKPLIHLRKQNKNILGTTVCPDKASKCPDGNTCCKLSSDQYGCCPLPNAMCCDDGVHCCPNGYTCDTSSGRCSKGDSVLPLFKKTPAKQLKNVVCPDGASECPDGNTCCKLSSGQYGCCPLPNAVCCDDGVHCCPNGYTCDTASGTCNKGDSVLPLFKKTPAKQLKNVVCPDGTSQCPDGNTCCKLSFGQYGCCPLPNAVCCDDGVHCCPDGYTCNSSSGTCSEGDSVLPLFKKTPAKQLKNVVCPDGASHCPDGNTCCKLSSGQYGCCPLPNAVCCDDGVHCCPNGYTCNSSGGTCNKGDSVLPLFKKTPAKQLKHVVCPDGTSQCPDGNTCCKLSSGQYGCCPLPNAVCCDDGVHCCPNGYTCNSSSGTCSEGDSVLPLFKKTPAKQLKNVVCPDETSQCPDGNTCCKLSSGQYGCCPLPNAVCCDDGVHCCPNGYTCDTSSGSCNKGDSVLPLFKKTLAKQLKNVVCPGGEAECPDGNTCCKLSSGQYGCCPLPNAVCCDDGSVLPLVKKTPAQKFKHVICEGSHLACPDGTTCCKKRSGGYACCPIPKAVCCSDEVHCCPNGYSCDLSSKKCVKGASRVPILQNSLALCIDIQTTSELSTLHSVSLISAANNRPGASGANYITCNDGSHCYDYETCCELSTGSYGCCPLPNAVCCSDGKHCCPCGYHCDISSSTCDMAKDSTPMVSYHATVQRAGVGEIKCKDGSHCNTGETCCLVGPTKYGCCPLPSAVCCADMQHCCPSGYTCNDKSEHCQRGRHVLPMFQKHPSVHPRPAVAKTPVIIDHTIRFVPRGGRGAGCTCEPYHTCCGSSSAQQHCCPLPNASCCSDGLHCCPQGFICDDQKGCVKQP
ncbi:progranulin-like isoform X2 [Nematostella vectensis]|uniref:progranulin-like isoform X2 n=1 Tax=Nematostella vectensis TaxID=45351 RepID=UPI00207715F5|nr:progranulin-like isoform X2 [Nematostella vectensis]